MNYLRHISLILSVILLAACGNQEGPTNLISSGLKTESKDRIPEQKPPEHEKPDFAPMQFDFKGIYIGGSRSEVKKRFPKLVGVQSRKGGISYELGDYFIFCGADTPTTEFTMPPCKGVITIANQTPEFAEFKFFGNSVASILIKFDNAYFSTVAQGLIEKFGPPQQMETTELTRILTGVKVDFIRMTWRFNKEGDIQSMKLMSHEPRGSNYLSRGVFTISSVAWDVEHERRANESGKKSDEKDL